MIIHTSNSYTLNVLPLNSGRFHSPKVPVRPTVKPVFKFVKLLSPAYDIKATKTKFVTSDIMNLVNKGIPLVLCSLSWMDPPSLMSPRCKDKVFV